VDLDEFPGAKRTALLVTCASILQITESFLPRLPLPGIRLGLANMITLVALVDLGFVPALEVALLRTLISSFLMGTFLSPAFILSFCSALSSTLVMGAFYPSLSRLKKSPVSLTGISLAGAAAHNLTQISVVYLILIRNSAVFMLMPWLGISAVVTGFATGIVASKVCEELEKPAEAGSNANLFSQAQKGIKPPGWLLNGAFSDGGRSKTSIRPEYKLIACIVLALSVLLFNSITYYLCMALALAVTAIISRVGIGAVIMPVRKAWFFLLFSLLVPAFFNASGRVLFGFHGVRITDAGLAEGGMFAFRLVILMVSAGLLVRTTQPGMLAKGIEKILDPLRFTGLRPDRISAIVVYSWVNLPQFWERAMILVKKYSTEKKFGFKSVISSFASILAVLYRQAE
jgi:heptaprenyl diphosphate synthase